jgi:L-fuconolactonase
MLRIDAHHHLWRYHEDEYGWIGDDMQSLRRDFLLDDLRAAMRTANVAGTIAVQARQSVEETRWLLNLAEAEDSPLLGVVGWLPIAADDFKSQLETFRDHARFKGLRHVVQVEPDGFLAGKDFNRGIRALAGTGLVYEILIYARQLSQAIDFVDAHPEQSFVIDHIGKPDIRRANTACWCVDISELALRPNIACKLSGVITEANPLEWTPGQIAPYLDVVLEAFGPDRLMIGTDWPVLTVGCTYEQWWRTVEDWAAPLTALERAMILGDTASRVYGLVGTLA